MRTRRIALQFTSTLLALATMTACGSESVVLPAPVPEESDASTPEQVSTARPDAAPPEDASSP